MKKLIDYMNSVSPITENTSKKLRLLFNAKRLNKKDNFIDSGKVTKKAGFLEKGIMRSYYIDNKGKEYNKHFFIAPCFIGGYSSLISGKPNQINQQALTNCDIWEVNHEELTNLYDSHPDLERVSRIIAEQLFVQKEQREVEIVLLNADKRYDIFRKEFPMLLEVIPQYHIASYLGITPTQLSRIRRSISKK